MTYVVKMGKDLKEAPYCFRQFYSSVGRVAQDKQRLLNELLSYEPYAASLQYDDDRNWRLEFASRDDWTQFQLRWT
jgi:hypothetical protein